MKEQVNVGVTLRVGRIDSGVGERDASARGQEIGSIFQGQLRQFLGRLGEFRKLFQAGACLQPLDLRRGHHEQVAERSLGALKLRARLGDLHVKLIELRGQCLDHRQRGLSSFLDPRLPSDQFRQTFATLKAQKESLPRGDHVDVGGVEIIHPLADRVGELGLDGALGPLRHDRSRDPLLGHVERYGHVHVILRLTARPIVGIVAERNELTIGVENRIGAKAGGQDVGLRHRNLIPKGLDLKIALDIALNRRVESETVGRTNIFRLAGILKRTEIGNLRRLKIGSRERRHGSKVSAGAPRIHRQTTLRSATHRRARSA